MKTYWAMVVHVPTLTSPLWILMEPTEFRAANADELREKIRQQIGTLNGLQYDVLVYEGYEHRLEPHD